MKNPPTCHHQQVAPTCSVTSGTKLHSHAHQTAVASFPLEFFVHILICCCYSKPCSNRSNQSYPLTPVASHRKDPIFPWRLTNPSPHPHATLAAQGSSIVYAIRDASGVPPFSNSRARNVVQVNAMRVGPGCCQITVKMTGNARCFMFILFSRKRGQ